MDVEKVINTIQERLDAGGTTYQSGNIKYFDRTVDQNQSMSIKKPYLSASPSKNTADETVKHISSQMLPDIKGVIKNVKQLVKQDLIEDGIRKPNIPFSSFRQRHFSTQAESKYTSQNLMFTSPSNHSLIKLNFDPSQSSIGASKPKVRGLNIKGIKSL
jgi:hypothetical protein